MCVCVCVCERERERERESNIYSRWEQTRDIVTYIAPGIVLK